MTTISISKIDSVPVYKREVEFVERKGVGHPDYIADAVAEAASLGLCRYYREKYDVILHHNVDKVLVVGGQAKPEFGGGEIIRPIRIIIAGRVTMTVELEHNGKKEIDIVPVEEIIVSSAKKWIQQNFRYLDPENHVIIECALGSGSVDLVGLFKKGLRRVPHANDTSLGVGIAPLTPTERLVYGVERLLNSREFKAKIPATGEDVKVMAFRQGSKVLLTVACALISHHLRDKDEYLSCKEEIKRSIEDYASKVVPELDVEVYVNTADDPDRGIYYLTITGTSAECGDDGCTGRGNRVRGLITPMRPMSMEAAAGKNPVNHIGKLYNILANVIADRIYEQVRDIEEAHVYLLSQIGRPINEPLSVSVDVITGKEITGEIRNEIEAIVHEELNSVTKLTDLVISERLTIPLF